MLSESCFKHNVTLCWLELCKIVGNIIFALRPNYSKDTLSYAIADPVIAHVDGFGTAELDGVIGDADGGHVVGVHGRGWLLVTECLKYNTLEVCVLRIDI